MAGLIGDLDDDSQRWEIRQHFSENGNELRVHHHGGGPGIIEQVAQFLCHVAVVDIERNDAGFDGPQHGLEIFVAVMKVDR
jgi:hypothetical protein